MLTATRDASMAIETKLCRCGFEACVGSSSTNGIAVGWTLSSVLTVFATTGYTVLQDECTHARDRCVRLIMEAPWKEAINSLEISRMTWWRDRSLGGSAVGGGDEVGG